LSRFIRTISQSVGALAVTSLLCTSVAVANPTTTVSADPTTTTATASSIAPAPAAPAASSAVSNATATAADADDIAQGGPLADVPQGHWAYDAVAQLVKDGLIVGYPDGQFKGNRPMTRYEAAVLTYRAVDQIEAQITAGKAVNQADIDAVKKLIAAFGKELKDVEAHVDALQKTVDTHSKTLSDLKAEADATQLRVNQGKLGFNIIVKPGTGGYTLNGVTATGAPLAAGTTVAFGPGANSTAKIGSLNSGVMYDVGRIFLGGQIDPRWSYGARLATAIKYSPFDATSVSPSYCTGSTGLISPSVTGTAGAANCAYTLLNFGVTPPQNTLPINLDYFFAGYSSPGGITAQFGRYSVGAYGKFATNPNGSLLFGGSGITGANVGFSDPRGHFYAQFYYGQQSVNQLALLTNGTNTNAGGANLTCTQNIIGLNTGAAGGQGSFNGINPFCTAQQNEEGGWLLYYFSGPRVAIGGAMDNQQGKQYTFYNPNLVGCTIKALPLATTAASPALCTSNGGTLSAAYLANPKVIGGYLNGQSAVQAFEGYLTAYFGPKSLPTWSFAATYARHIGVNPFTGGAWQQADAESAAITYASKGNLFAGGGYTNPLIIGGGRRNSNVVELSYNRFGLYSLSNIENTDIGGSTPFENNLGFSGINGLQTYGIQAAHWFSDSVRFGVNAIHLQNNNNGTIPISNGSFITQVNENQLNGEMYLYFF
jgi:hypothetical protein